MDSNLPSYFWFKLKQSINLIDRDRFDQFIDGCAQEINYKDYRGMNLLMFYLFYANPIDPFIIKVVASLVDINHTDDIYGNSALHFADRNPSTTAAVF